MTPRPPRPDWHEYFLAVAKIVSTRSTCNSRPAGAVIVRDKQILTTGYNGSVPGAPHCTDQTTPDGSPYCFRRSIGAPDSDKYNYCRAAHAEANAVALAARQGITLAGATLYTTLAPCYVCMKLLAVAQVRHIYYEHDYESVDRTRDAHWQAAVKECGFETFVRLSLSRATVDLLAGALRAPTSSRRIPGTDPAP